MNQKPQTNQPKNPLKQLNFKVHPDFYWKLKNFASTKRLKMSEVFEKSFEFYQQRETVVNDKINLYQQNIQAIENQLKPFLSNMSLMELALRINKLSPKQFNKIGLTATFQVLKGSLSDWFRLEKEKRGFKN